MKRFLQFYFIIQLIFLLLIFSANASISLSVLKDTNVEVTAVGESIIDTEKYRNRSQAVIVAKRVATLDAYRKILEQIGDIVVSGETKIKDMMLEDDTIKTKIDGKIASSKIIKVDIAEDIVSVTVSVTAGRDIYNLFSRN